MQLIEGQMCVFLNKRRQIRSNRIRIESARVRGQIKMTLMQLQTENREVYKNDFTITEYY